MEGTTWMHRLESDIRLRKAITAFGEWTSFDDPDPGNFKWFTLSRMRESLRLHWPDEEEGEWLASLMRQVLQWRKSTNARKSPEWLFDGHPTTETDLRDTFAQQVLDQPEAYWGEDEWTEADNETIEREYTIWVKVHMRDGILHRAADLEPDELKRLIRDRDEEGNLTEDALGLLDAWANAPDEQSPADERICQLACLLADYHGLPEGRIRDETFAEATLINVWLHRADCISSPTETYDEIIAFAAGIHVE